MKNIYFKEKVELSPSKFHNGYCCELLWKTHRLWPFWNKMDGVFDILEKQKVLVKYSATYNVLVYDPIFSEYVPLKFST